MLNSKEAKARIKINKLLEEVGWRLVDDQHGRSNVDLEPGVDITKAGDDFENTEKGYIDYLLLDKNNFPIAVLEAKRESIHPLSAKEQARDYAKGKNVRFIILSNGISHYFWDLKGGEPEQITEFPTQDALIHRQNYQENIEDLATAFVDKNYLNPERTGRVLRYYQVEAIHAIQNAAKQNKKRYLLEMATGTGKTTTAAAICKLFLKTGNAKRILFLVDRIELEDQAVRALRQLFEGEYFIGTIKEGSWNEKHIVVSTVQTLLAGNRYRKEFAPIDFELVISDEAHRSLGGNSRAVFEYFLGYKLGLTATPKDYLRGVDEKELVEKNIRALEQRNLRDTYKTFGCEGGEPTYRYDLKRGVQDGYLINPWVIDARTNITTQMLSEEGYAVQVDTGDGENQEEIFGARDFERKYFNENTNQAFARAILDKGLKDPITGEFGKTIVFCVSQNHAAKITNILNKLAREKWPDKYDSDFAVQITSWVSGSQQFTKDFANNRLLGKSRFAENSHPGYETSKARIAVTVGMMTTGYDCPDLLNIALLRPIFSPADFIQMKGRGTRKFTFKDQETGEEIEKNKFNLLDFFGNYEYFEKEYNYNERLPLNILLSSNKNTEIESIENQKLDIDKFVDLTADNIEKYVEIQIGDEGMKIDREAYKSPHEQFEQVLQTSHTIQEIKEKYGIDAVENFIKAEVLNRPTEYWTVQKIRNSYEREYNTKRKIPFTEIILKALGLQPRFKTREERIEEEYEKFIDIERPNISDDDPEKIQLTREFFEHYLSDSEFRDIIKKKEFGRLATYPGFSITDLEKLNGLIFSIQSYIDEYLYQETREFAWSE